MKRFLLWISAAALTASSAAADTNGVLLRKVSSTTPYAGIPGITSEVQTSPRTLPMNKKKTDRTVAGFQKSERLRIAAKGVSLPVNTQLKAAGDASAYMPELLGSVIYSDDQNFETGAVYQIPSATGGEFAYVFGAADDNDFGPDATYGGVIADGKYYAQMVYSFFGMQFPVVNIHDVETGELLAEWMTEGEELAMDLAYNPVDKQIYGLCASYTSEEEDATPVYNISKITYPDFDDIQGVPTVEAIMPLPGDSWYSLAIDKDGKFFAMRQQAGTGILGTPNSRLWSIDIENKTTQSVSTNNIGVGPAYNSSATFDFATNRLFWAVSAYDDNGYLYEINTTTGRGTRLCKFANGEQVVGLGTTNPVLAEGVPACASNIALNYAPGSKSGNITFNLPEKLFNGEDAQGTLSYTVKANSEIIASGQGTPGQLITVEHTFATSGTVRVSVEVSNAAGAAPATSASAYIGYAAAESPTNIKVIEDAEGHVTITWDAVTKDINGVTLPAVTYTVGIVEQTQFGATITDFLVEEGTANSVSAQVMEPGTPQELIQFAVFAECEGGVSQGVPTPLYFVGAPYTEFLETFANGGLSHDATLRNNDGSNIGSWQLGNDEIIPDQNGDNGFITHYGRQPNGSSTLGFGKIDLKGIANPVLTFYVYALDTQSGAITTDNLEVTVNEPFAEPVSVFNKAISEIATAPGWTPVSIDLSAYKDKIIQLGFTGLIKQMVMLPIDNIYVGQKIGKDAAAVRISAPDKVKAGENFTASVRINNEGSVEAPAHKVNLYVDGAIAQTKDVPAIAVGSSANVAFTVPMHILAEAPLAIKATIELEGDERESNDSTATVSVAPVVSALPFVKDLTATVKDKTVTLTWSEPEVPTSGSNNLVDFEDATAFAQNYGNWTFVDEDNAAVGGFQNLEIPGIASGSSKASFFIMEEGGNFNQSFAAHSGTKSLVSLFRYDGGKVSDWAISPELDGSAQTITFWAKSYSGTYPESIEVLISSTTTAISAFKVVTPEGVVPEQWTEYRFDVPAGTKYFAVHSVATDSFMLMLDDFEFKAAPIAPPVLTGFDIYRDGVKLNATPLDEAAYTDAVAEDGVYNYVVTALWDKGVSKGSNAAVAYVGVSGIDAAVSEGVAIAAADKAIVVSGAAGLEITVSAIDGKTVFEGQGKDVTTITVAQGIYVVKAGKTVAKIIVR